MASLLKSSLSAMKSRVEAFLAAATRGQIGLGSGAILLLRAIVVLSGCSGSWLNWVRGHLTDVVSGVHRIGQKNQLLAG